MIPILFLFSLLTPVDESGYQKLVSAHKGHVVLYNFWATWCAGCRAEMPDLVKLEQKLKARGFEMVTISADEPEQITAAEKFLAKNGISASTYRKQPKKDEDFINAIDSKWTGALPALFLYDKQGRKSRSFIGETEMKTIEAAIAKLL